MHVEDEGKVSDDNYCARSRARSLLVRDKPCHRPKKTHLRVRTSIIIHEPLKLDTCTGRAAAAVDARMVSPWVVTRNSGFGTT